MKISVKELNQILAQQTDLKQRLESEMKRSAELINTYAELIDTNNELRSVITTQEKIIAELQQYVPPAKIARDEARRYGLYMQTQPDLGE